MEVCLFIDLSEDPIEKLDDERLMVISERNTLFTKTLCIQYNQNKPLSELFLNDTNYQDFIEEVKQDSDCLLCNSELEAILSYLESHTKEEVFKDIREIQLMGNIEDLISYCHDNKAFMEEKDLLYLESYSFSMDGLKNAQRDVSLFKEKTGLDLKVRLDNDYEFITIEQFKGALNLIIQKVNLIKSLNLSPLENIMIIYDEIRKKPHKEEGENESNSKSRDIISILFDDYIVCSGYIKLFNIYMNLFHYKAFPLYLKGGNEQGGHAQSLVYIEDEKYQYKGILVFDLTGDNGKKKDYLNRYFFFGKSLKEMEILNKGMGIEYEAKCLSQKYLNTIREELPLTIDYFYSCINPLFRYQLNPLLVDLNLPVFEPSAQYKKKDFLLMIDALHSLSKPLSIELFTKLVYQVRKIEYYLNPESVPFEIGDLTDAVYSHSLYKVRISEADKLMCLLLGIDDKREMLKKIISLRVKRAIDEGEIKKVKLTRLLRNELNKKLSLK